MNRERPGHATVRILEGMDHGFLARDYEESVRIARGEAPATLDPRIVDELDSWMAAFGPRVTLPASGPCSAPPSGRRTAWPGGSSGFLFSRRDRRVER